MASITLRDLHEQTKERLRVRAARKGRSMEDEARNSLRTALAQDTKTARNLARAIRKRFEPLGGVELGVARARPDARTAATERMIILDTNVVSELMKPAPADRVIRWVASRTATTSLYKTSTTYAEILHGILWLPAGKRRKSFDQAAEMMFDEDFAGRTVC